MAINADKSQRWERDAQLSIQLYDAWYQDFAPTAHKNACTAAEGEVRRIFGLTAGLRDLTGKAVLEQPETLPVLRMMTSPPLAKDRLGGLVDATRNTVNKLEDGRWPPMMGDHERALTAAAIAKLVRRMCDQHMITWLGSDVAEPAPGEVQRAIAVISDRLAQSRAASVIRNEQERRQIRVLKGWLTQNGYQQRQLQDDEEVEGMPAGTFAVRPTIRAGDDEDVNVPVDVAVQPHQLSDTGMPVLVEAKSAGDSANTNKRWKEEENKLRGLQARYGASVPYLLFLGGYFDERYLEKVAKAGLDWVWEHRVDELDQAGL